MPLITAINDRNFWPEILAELNARLPEADIWITNFTPCPVKAARAQVKNTSRKRPRLRAGNFTVSGGEIENKARERRGGH